MSDSFAPLHCPSTGLLRRSQARIGLSKAYTSIFNSNTFIITFNQNEII